MVRRLLSWIGDRLRRRDLTAEIDEELQFHLDARIRDNQAAGMSDAEARRDAFRRFGSRAALREATRDANLFVHVERLWQDLRHGARISARNPALTAIAIISIAFGTGANVAIFSMADTLLLRPLPVPRPSDLVSIGSRVRNGPFYRTATSYPDYLDVRDRTQSFDGVLAFVHETVGLTTTVGELPRVRFATFVSTNFFRVLTIEPQVGRGFLADEDGKARPDTVAVLSDAFWRGQFGADPNILGRTIRVSGVEVTIIGVAPASFSGLDRYLPDEVFLPVTMLPRVGNVPTPAVLDARDARVLVAKGRLRPGVTLDQAHAELAALGRDLERQHPVTNSHQTLLAQTELAYQATLRPLDLSLVIILTTLSIAVLCVACANVAGLLASRGPVRAREMALRLAIGAGRGRLVRQLLTESLGIAIAGGAGGIAVGWLGISLLRQIQYPTELVKHPRFDLDERALLVAILVAMASAVLVGLGPALQTTRVDLVSTLKSTDRGRAVRYRPAGRSILVAVQVALSLVLVTVSVYAVQAFRQELDAGPGFRTTQMTKATISPNRAGYKDVDAVRFLSRVLDEARALPGVRSASVTSAMPLFSFDFAMVAPEGETVVDDQSRVPTWANSIDDRYFETMGIPLLAGRTFVRTDDASAPLVAIVNDTFARRVWPGADPIGKRIQRLDAGRQLHEIVGVVTTSTYGIPGELPQDAVYFPFLQQRPGEMVLLVQTAGESAAVLEPVRDLVQRLDRDVPLSDVQTIEAFYEHSCHDVWHPHGQARRGHGRDGRAAHDGGAVRARLVRGQPAHPRNRHPHRDRRDVGPDRQDDSAPGDGARVGGPRAGLLLSVALSRLLSGLVPFFGYRVSAQTYSVVVPLLVAISLAASFLPARRAAGVDPTTALRAE